MMLKRARLIVILALALPISLALPTGASALDSASPNPKVTWSSINTAPQSWIRGVPNRLFECVSNASSAVLSMKDGAQWREITRVSAVLDKKLCADAANPYILKYQFTIQAPSRGAGNFPGTRAGLVIFRIQSGGATRMSSAALYANREAADSDEMDGHALENDEASPPVPAVSNPAPVAQPNQNSGAATSAAPASAPTQPQSKSILKSFPSCKFNGVALTGRAKVVSAGGQIKVRVVPGVADFGVRTADRSTGKCGEWRFVSTQADFTVEIVDSGEDFTISFSMRPGPR
ncbi:MAG: hypothetical protein F2652_03810 [Actinobacteria bacterium]|uniref:Unannotated protein n=1 Tax=freshwater metagenome TaxID=449393 RepID=A0A6J6MSH0_9ZZZZ|nr:hypothetical protein [Actinomycetota bacterium]